MNDKSPHIPTHRQVIDKILNRLADAEQPLPRSLEFYRKILTIQTKTKLPDLAESTADFSRNSGERLSQGKPLLAFSDLEINWEYFQSLYNELLDLSMEFLTPNREETEEAKKIGSDLDLLQETTKTWFGIKTVSRKSNSKNNDINQLTSSIVQATLYPLLSIYSDKLLPLVTQEAWYKRYCPVCGGEADFGFLDREKDGARWLLCSRCDAQWLFYRLVCPHCGNDDQQSLAYFTNDTSVYRLYVCEKCRHYLKTIDLRKTEAEILLPLERILTLDMDRQAHESNYEAD
jgi:FdhE protein